MKFFLVINEHIQFSEGHDEAVNLPNLQGDLYCRYQAVVTTVSPISKANQPDVIKCSKLRSLLREYTMATKPSTTSCREIQIRNVDLRIAVSEILNETGRDFKGYISIEGLVPGNILEWLQELCDGDAKIQIELVTLPRRGITCQISTVEMGIHHSKCVDYNMLFPVAHFDNFRSENFEAVVSISVTIPDEALNGKYRKPDAASEHIAIPINQLILEQELLSDVTIIAENGAPIKAHKVFLAAKSPVFLAMFQVDMTESSERTVDLPDMTEESVRALLKYLYYDDITSPEENSLVAFELFNAGHKYNIISLESSMRELLANKPNEWYDIDVGVKLFLFARNISPVDENLKLKAIQVLKQFADKLEGSPTYDELFKKDGNAARELCKYALSTK